MGRQVLSRTLFHPCWSTYFLAGRLFTTQSTHHIMGVRSPFTAPDAKLIVPSLNKKLGPFLPSPRTPFSGGNWLDEIFCFGPVSRHVALFDRAASSLKRVLIGLLHMSFYLLNCFPAYYRFPTAKNGPYWWYNPNPMFKVWFFIYGSFQNLQNNEMKVLKCLTQCSLKFLNPCITDIFHELPIDVW